MARVNVEERAFKQFEKAARVLGWDPRLFAGAMLWLWNVSQEKRIVEARADDICRWAEVEGEEQQRAFIAALVKYELLRPVIENQAEIAPDEPYHICGNGDQIAWTSKNAENAKKGGEATRERWRRLREQQQRDQFFGNGAPPPNETGEVGDEGEPPACPWPPGDAEGEPTGLPPACDRPGDEDEGGPIGLAPLGIRPSAGQGRQPKRAPMQGSSMQGKAKQINAEKEIRDSGFQFANEGRGQADRPSLPDLEPSAQGQGLALLPSPGSSGDVPRGTSKTKKPKLPLGAIPEFQDSAALVDLLQQVTQTTQRAWLEMFVESPEDMKWLRGTLLNVCVWREANPGKGAKPGGARFPSWLTTWLKKDYDRRPQRGSPARARTRAESIDQAHQDLIDRIERGEV